MIFNMEPTLSSLNFLDGLERLFHLRPMLLRKPVREISDFHRFKVLGRETVSFAQRKTANNY